MFEFLVDTMSRNSLIKEIISTHIENDVNCDNLSSLTISSKQWVLVVMTSVVVFPNTGFKRLCEKVCSESICGFVCNIKLTVAIEMC